MKRCPECRKDYQDDSLIYCLDDGAALIQGSVTDEPATAILSGDRASGERLTEVLNNDPKPKPRAVTSSLRGRLPWVLAALLALAATVLAYGYFNRSSNKSSHAVRLAFEPPAELAFNDKLPDWAVISPDGQRFVLGTLIGDPKVTAPTVIMNWPELLKK